MTENISVYCTCKQNPTLLNGVYSFTPLIKDKVGEVWNDYICCNSTLACILSVPSAF